MAAKPSFNDPSEKDDTRPVEKRPGAKREPAPTRTSRHDQPVDFPVSDTAVSQADGVP